MTDHRRRTLGRRIRFLVAATIAYNVIEAVVAITAGTVASSAALVGFGLDSVIEVASAITVAWQFAGADPEARERTALRVIAMSFLALAAYVSVDAAWWLFGGQDAQNSTVGLVVAGLIAAGQRISIRSGVPSGVTLWFGNDATPSGLCPSSRRIAGGLGLRRRQYLIDAGDR